MHPQSTIAHWCDRVLEYGWLLCIALIPSYFNLLSARHFEPDKAILFRAFVSVLIAIAVIRWLDSRMTPRHGTPPTRPVYSLLGYSIVAYGVIFVFATVTSIVPGISFWGSYQRMQGTYTNLSYVALALILARHVRTPAQLWRIVFILVASAIVPTLYGFVQHLELDPLPWKGDVITRVASTMGNSIFIAAFLILIVPYALAAGLTFLNDRASSSANNLTRFRFFAIALGVLGAVCLVFTAIQFSGVVRSIDLRFWWVYPGAVLVASMVYIGLLWLSTAERATRYASLAPAIAATLYGICLLVSAQTSSEVKFIPPTDGRFGEHWIVWLLGSIISIWWSFFAQTANTQQSTQPQRYTKILGYLCLGFVVACLITIFFTQSRGPWIGGAFGIFFFVTVTLLDIRRRGGQLAKRATQLFIAECSIVGFIMALLFVFNFSNAPAVVQLREVPYIGRMGKLFDVGAGTTGDVRMKIWFGDEHGKGTIGLITSNPLRTVIGWGPESMFVAYNAFYPPSLANIESRSASPDRSHQAFLDELVNKGLLGLFSYLALIITALGYGFNLLKRSSIAPYRYLVIAAMSSIVAHNIEGLTGIPVVASLMLQWISIGVLLCIATLTTQPDPSTESAPNTTPTPQQSNKPTQTGRRRSTTLSQKPVLSSTESTPLQYLSSALILLLGISSAWSFNIDNALADMRFQQGTSYAEAATNSGNTDQQIIGLSYFLDAIRMEPNQDYYYLSAGRSLLNLADSQRRIGGNSIAPQETDLRELLTKESAIDIKEYIEPRATHDIVKLAESMLLAAHDLNPYNKDHFANLARLYTFWYTRVEQTPELDAAILSWFQKGVENAPNDVSILNEYTRALINRANRLRDTDPPESARMRELAHLALDRSLELDPRYTDTAIRIADLRYADGKYTEAMPLYAEILKKNPHALDGQISTIVDQLSGTPALLEQLRTAYKATPYQNDRLLLSILGLISSRLRDYPEAIAAFGQLVAIQPNSIEALQNYTIVLSNGLEYQNAAIQAENLVALATTQQLPEQTVALYQQLADFLRAKAP